jgi:inorganic phosphate transporter, PiT family
MTPFLITVIALALIFDYINGFHDAANSIATVVSTKVLTPFQAVLWAALFNSIAFFIFKDHGVADTVAKTVKPAHIEGNMMLVIFAGLIAAILWNLLTWWFGIPSSSSHTLIGGFAGAAIASGGFAAVNSSVILKTASFILLAPLVGMLMAFLISLWFLSSFKKGHGPKIFSSLILLAVAFFLYNSIRTSPTDLASLSVKPANERLVVEKVTSNSNSQKMGFKKDDVILSVNNQPITSKASLNAALKPLQPNDSFSYVVLRKGKDKIESQQTVSTVYKTSFDTKFLRILMLGQNFKWILLAAIIATMAIFTFFLNSLNAHRANQWFKRLQLISSAAFSIGHGGNDAQKVMGIITAALIAGNVIPDIQHMPNWVPLACYGAIGLGTMSGGWKIIKTMGTKITKVTPFEGVAAETAGAVTLFVTEALKIPVSTTHTITGSIMGVGATKRLSAVRWGVTVSLVWAWVLTIPISGLLAAGIYKIASLF